MERVARLSQVQSDVREREKACESWVVALRVGCDIPVHLGGAVMGIGRHEAELAGDRAWRLADATPENVNVGTL